MAYDEELADRIRDARLMEMRGRRTPGWLRVDHDDVRTKVQLSNWVRIGATYARSLPQKRAAQGPGAGPGTPRNS